MINTTTKLKVKKDKTFWGYKVEVSNGNKYFVEFNWEAPKSDAWYLFEGEDCINGELLESGSTKREMINLIKIWNEIN